MTLAASVTPWPPYCVRRPLPFWPAPGPWPRSASGPLTLPAGRFALGFPPDPLTGSVPVPHPATVRRLLARLDGDAFDQAVGAFLAARGSAGERRVIAVDGKTVRGSRTRERPAVSLLAAMDQHGNVLARRQVDDKSNEIPAFAPLLETIDLDGTVITADGLHTQHDHARYLLDRGADYIAVVKPNHPTPYDRIRSLPWKEISLDHAERTRAHHRYEIRRLKTAAFRHIAYPGARQALQVVRWRRDLAAGKLTIERVYLVTSLNPGEASGARIASWIREHWSIENKTHHVRDRTFREDDSKVHFGRGASLSSVVSCSDRLFIPTMISAVGGPGKLSLRQQDARLRRRAKPARPNTWRLSILIRLTCPSTTPELQDSVRPAMTASRSRSMPAARVWRLGRSSWRTASSRCGSRSPWRSVSIWASIEQGRAGRRVRGSRSGRS